MRSSVRRFGPVLLWQLGTLLLWLAALAIASRLSFEAPFLESLGTLLGLLLLIGIPAFLQEASRKLLAHSWNGRPPAIAADFSRLTGRLAPGVPVAASSAINIAMQRGFVIAALTFTVVFILFVTCLWTAWARGYLRAEAHEEPQEPKRPRGLEAGGMRFITEEHGEGGDELGFRVVVDGSVSTRAVLTAFTAARLLPRLPGGSRTWSVLVEERPVAVATQTWEHPRWWPPIEWSMDPDEPFPAGGVLCLRVVSGVPA